MDFNKFNLSSIEWKNFQSIYNNKNNRLPLIGSICYCTYNLHMSLNGGLSSLIPSIGNRSLNLLLLTSHIGIGYYINRQKHIQQCHDHIIISIYGSLMFNLSSFLFTAIMKNFIPQSQLFRSIFAMFIAMMNIYMGRKIFKIIT
ncbi:uncharacterized protein LOC124496778 [Dermatophagoides farinae]|uniref:uncharacterized protein LOC124496778 n=1 Tax=Dermatophagoides farinae TaxID=6954 RepID=UPI003F63E5F9